MSDPATPATLLPLSMRADTLCLDQFTPGWNLAAADTNASQPRVFRTRITFETPFSSVPVVHVGLTGFDIDNDDTARLEVRATAIAADGFELQLHTWLYTRVYQASIGWLALGH